MLNTQQRSLKKQHNSVLLPVLQDMGKYFKRWICVLEVFSEINVCIREEKQEFSPVCGLTF